MSKELIYLIKDGKGFIKEFNFKGLLIYEGDYLNGKGKEYDYIYKKVVYVGEYLDGKRNGKGKEYYLKGNLKFEGEFKNGLKWSGNGYDENNNIIYTLKNGKGYIKNELSEKYDFEGEYLIEKRYKKGKEYNFKGGLKYEGEYFNGQKNGKGKEYYFNGKLKFEGEYLYNTKRKGKTYYLDGKLEFEGEYLFDKKWNGKIYDKNGNIICELHNGNGYLKKYNDNCKLVFEGEYINGDIIGKVKEY